MSVECDSHYGDMHVGGGSLILRSAPFVGSWGESNPMDELSPSATQIAPWTTCTSVNEQQKTSRLNSQRNISNTAWGAYGQAQEKCGARRRGLTHLDTNLLDDARAYLVLGQGDVVLLGEVVALVAVLPHAREVPVGL